MRIGHTISPAGIMPNTQNVEALMKILMPEDLKQLRSLFRGLSYYKKFLYDMPKRIRPITSLLKQGVKFVLTSAMEAIVRELVAELFTPPVLTLTETASPTTPALFSTVMPVWTVSALFSNTSKTTIPSAPSCSSAALRSSLNVTGSGSTWQRPASFGAPSAFEVTYGVPISDLFRTTRRSKAPTRLQDTTREYRGG